MKNRSKAFTWFIVVMLLLCAGGIYLMILGISAPRPLPQPAPVTPWGEYAHG